MGRALPVDIQPRSSTLIELFLPSQPFSTVFLLGGTRGTFPDLTLGRLKVIFVKQRTYPLKSATKTPNGRLVANEMKADMGPAQDPQQMQIHSNKRKLAHNADLYNSAYFKIRSLARELRPHFIQVSYFYFYLYLPIWVCSFPAYWVTFFFF